jgi:hypothetical protein
MLFEKSTYYYVCQNVHLLVSICNRLTACILRPMQLLFGRLLVFFSFSGVGARIELVCVLQLV